MFGVLDISASGLVAQRTRMDVTAANIANQFSLTDLQGNYAPYRRRTALLAPGDPATGKSQGVHVQEILLDKSPLRTVFEPGNPFADAEGYVKYPNVDLATEAINQVEAARAYDANIAAAEATKAMIQASLRLLA